MSTNSAIEWTDATWNPVRGCVKISPGCKHCYAETFAERFRGVPGHPYEQGFEPTIVEHKLEDPLHWRRPRHVFVNSMSDAFGEFVPDEYIAAVFGVMAAAPRHTFQVLTKRAERLPDWFAWVDRSARFLGSDEVYDPRRLGVALHHAQRWSSHRTLFDTDPILRRAWPLDNVHVGVSVEDRRYGLPRIAHLRAVPAAVRFLSIEPLLEDLGQLDLSGIGWVIVGGESGPGARPMHPAWVRSIRDQCEAAGVPFFFKQWGQWVEADVAPGGDLGGEMRRGITQVVHRDRAADGHFRAGDVLMRRVLSKKGAGRVLDGRTHDAMPSAAVPA